MCVFILVSFCGRMQVCVRVCVYVYVQDFVREMIRSRHQFGFFLCSLCLCCVRALCLMLALRACR